MTKMLCPQFPQFTLPMPLGIGNESTRTIAHAYNAFGLTRDGALPKALHVGKPDDVAAQHFILYPGGKQVDLTFAATLLNKDRAVLQCFESAIGFDRAHYEAKKDSVDQKTPLARFYQDQILEVWDPILKTKTNASEAGQPVVYKDLLKFWDDGIGDANTSTLNLAALQTILEHIERSDASLTVKDLLLQHDQAVGIGLQKGGVLCHSVDWGKTLSMNESKEYRLECDRPANLAELAVNADKNLPAGSFKLTPSNFGDGAQQLKILNLKPANLKEAATAFEVMPASPQAALDATGYETHHAVSKAVYWGVPAVLVGVALLTGIGGYLLGRKKAAKTADEKVKPAAEKKASKAQAAAPENKPAEKPAATKSVPSAESKADPKPDENEMEDVLNDLQQARAGTTPAPAKVSASSSASAVTPENVIISGEKAEPVSGITNAVIQAQILLLYRKFLKKTALDALLHGQKLPDGDIVEESYKNEISELTDRIMSAYFVKNGTAEGKESLAELWKTQLDDRGYIIRRGVPQHFLMEVGAEYINEHSKSSASSPFAGGVGAEIRSEAAKTAGETKYFQHGMRELMKRIGG